jgi:hypothetical protein
MIRFFDIIFSGIAIIILLMITLKLIGEHDIFYTQMRIGKDGKSFHISHHIFIMVLAIWRNYKISSIKNTLRTN